MSRKKNNCCKLYRTSRGGSLNLEIHSDYCVTLQQCGCGTKGCKDIPELTQKEMENAYRCFFTPEKKQEREKISREL